MISPTKFWSKSFKHLAKSSKINYRFCSLFQNPSNLRFPKKVITFNGTQFLISILSKITVFNFSTKFFNEKITLVEEFKWEVLYFNLSTGKLKLRKFQEKIPEISQWSNPFFPVTTALISSTIINLNLDTWTVRINL